MGVDIDGAGRPPLLDELSERSLTDIAREVEHLRLENAQLRGDLAVARAEIDRLRPELSQTQKETVTYRAAVKFLMREGGFLQPIMSTGPHFASLPPEILLRIFKGTMPPYHEHDPAALRPRNPWIEEIRFRKGLTLVCKTWSWPATAILYEDVVLRRMGQIPALARTLSSPNGRDFGVLIQHIRMDSCVVWAPCADVVQQDLSFILTRSVALRSFSFHGNPNFPIVNTPDEGNGWDGFNPSWFVDKTTIQDAFVTRISSGLRELDISMTLSETYVVGLHRLLSQATSLTSLKIGPVAVGGWFRDTPRTPLGTLELPSLRYLQLYTDHPLFVTLVCSSWKMPALQGLTAMNCRDIPIELLKKHGRPLTYLHICPKKNDRVYDYSWEPCATTYLDDDFASICPVLEHFVFPAMSPNQTPPIILRSLRSPTIRYVDIWCHACAATREQMEEECRVCDVMMLREERLCEQFDRDTVLGMFQASHDHDIGGEDTDLEESTDL
ncbi:hypothetical protein C8Q80DRAFT_46777 [Daedaleopsis nitida]|nr:hypothetical protein C8Q80DRAFT_46777 [Daedaleopsis nitida]